VNRRLAWLVAATDLALLLLLAGCAGGGTPPVTTGVTEGAPDASGAARSTENGRVRFVIRIPPKRHRGARFISPATKSMSLTISRSGKKAFSKRVNVTPSSSGCYASLAGTVCTVAFGVKVDKGYIASLTAYDGLNGTGNALSTGQSLPFDVKEGKLNTVALTLNGIPLSILVKQIGSNSILVTALDADGNFIVGPGAPTFAASQTSGAAVVSISQPSSSSPNTIGIALATSPHAPPATETIGVTASYPAGTANACAEPGAVCSLATAATATYDVNGTFFVGDYGNGAVKGFSTPFSGAGQAPAITQTMPAPWAVALDPSANVFAVQYSATGALYEFAPPYTGAPVTDAGIADDSYAIAFNSAGNVFIGGSSSVSEIAPPYTGAATSISSGVDSPYGLAFDSADNLYVANKGNAKLGVYASGAYTTEKYTVSLASGAYSAKSVGSKLYVGETSGVEIFSLPITSSAATPIAAITNGVNEAWSVALDTAGDLFVANDGAGTVTEYPAPVTGGEAPSVTLSQGLSEPCGGLSFDANGYLYVIDYSSGDVAEFAPPFTNSSVPVGTGAGMSSPCYGGLVGASGATFKLSVP
jgi:hypothetical protein